MIIVMLFVTCTFREELDPGDLGLKAIRFWNPIWDPYLGPLWTHLDLLRPNCPIWSHLVPFEKFRSIWIHLDLFLPIWTYMDKFGAIWSSLEHYGRI